MKLEVNSLEELKQKLSDKLLPLLGPKTVLLLSGEMGAGKTQLVKTFCELLKAQGDISSPTFSIINEYDSDLGVIHHVDLYRIESEGDLFNTGFWEIFEKDLGLIFIEWPTRANLSSISKDWKIIKIDIEVNNNKRILNICC